MIADRLAVMRANGGPAPDGTSFGDPTAGPGIWPDLS
jgi:hypothetical protein